MRLTYALGVTLSGTDYLRVFGQDDDVVPVGNSPAGKELLKKWDYKEGESKHWTNRDVQGGPSWKDVNAAVMIADLDEYQFAWDRQLRSALITCHQRVQDVAKLLPADFEAMLRGLSAVVQELLPGALAGQLINFVVNMNMGKWKSVKEVHLKAMIRNQSLYLDAMAPWHMPPIKEEVKAGFGTKVYYRHHDELSHLYSNSEPRSLTDEEKKARFFQVLVPGSPKGIDWQGSTNVPCVYAMGLDGRLNGLDEQQVLDCCTAIDSLLQGAGVKGYNFFMVPLFDGAVPAPLPTPPLAPAVAEPTPVHLFVRGFADLNVMRADLARLCGVAVPARLLCNRVTSDSKRSAILEVPAGSVAMLQCLSGEQLKMGGGTVYFAGSWKQGSSGGAAKGGPQARSGAGSSTPKASSWRSPEQAVAGGMCGSSTGANAAATPSNAPRKPKPDPFGGAKPTASQPQPTQPQPSQPPKTSSGSVASGRYVPPHER